MADANKGYETQRIENKWYAIWEEHHLFTPSNTDKKPPYVVMMPPPNVTGSLHNGHALFVTIQDILIRQHRMKGFNALWLPGVDHAGISTQSVVERELYRNEGKTRHEVGRAEFLRRTWAWKEKYGSRIIEQLKALGASADWSRCRFTLDDGCSHAVKEAFVRLWNDNLIYRGERLVNWDPAGQTALSDEEVEHKDRKGELWQFAYKVKDSDQEIVVATTRVETMLGDVAVAVHSHDERYAHMIGKNLVHPFIPHRVIKVIADEMVDKSFGTGAVKITPAHDPNDFAVAKRHNLEKINIFTIDGKVNNVCPAYEGLSILKAREKIKADITELGLFRGAKEIEHAVGISQRSGAVIEPRLSRQYFVHAKPLADKAMNAVDSGETRIIPESFKKIWDHFLGNIEDWCISRQLWWGHQIPVYYHRQKVCAAVEAYAQKVGKTTESFEALQGGKDFHHVLALALNELPDDIVRSFSIASVEQLSEDDYVQEEDVLDTWFSSGLWPFSTLGWPHNTDDLKAFYPGAVLETGFDILFFWVARMMMFGVHFMGQAPFKDIYLHAMVRDAHGQKMSKSLGNAIDPLDVMNGISLDELLEKTKTYPVPPNLLPKVIEGIKKDFADGIPASGADGLRLSLAMLSGQGRDVKLSIPRVAGYRNFLNKVWNASRFALMKVGEEEVKPLHEIIDEASLVDKWIITRLQEAVKTVNHALENYKFSEASEALYQFFWNEFCDWYIELVKPNFDAQVDEKVKTASRSVLVHVLDVSMRLLHPFCPFITEEIWQMLPSSAQYKEKGINFCAIAPYPLFDSALVYREAAEQMEEVKNTIALIRNARQESNIPVGQKITGIVLCKSAVEQSLMQEFASAISKLSHLSQLNMYVRGEYELPQASIFKAGVNVDIVLPLEGAIDFEKEKKRLEQDQLKITKQREQLVARVSNENFVKNAPAEVVEDCKRQLAELDDKLYKIKDGLERLAQK